MKRVRPKKPVWITPEAHAHLKAWVYREAVKASHGEPHAETTQLEALSSLICSVMKPMAPLSDEDRAWAESVINAPTAGPPYPGKTHPDALASRMATLREALSRLNCGSRACIFATHDRGSLDQLCSCLSELERGDHNRMIRNALRRLFQSAQIAEQRIEGQTQYRRIFFSPDPMIGEQLCVGALVMQKGLIRLVRATRPLPAFVPDKGRWLVDHVLNALSKEASPLPSSHGPHFQIAPAYGVPEGVEDVDGWLQRNVLPRIEEHA